MYIFLCLHVCKEPKAKSFGVPLMFEFWPETSTDKTEKHQFVHIIAS